jgi:hypothetical protein
MVAQAAEEIVTVRFLLSSSAGSGGSQAVAIARQAEEDTVEVLPEPAVIVDGLMRHSLLRIYQEIHVL